MIGRIVLATALLGGWSGWATSGLADGALAVGMPDGDPNKGFKWSAYVNNPNAASEVMTACRTARSKRTADACVLIESFRDQCVAVAVDGNPDAPVTSAGWAIAPDSSTAIDRAIAQCEARKKGHGKLCVLDGGRDNALSCDGSAK
jgi:hypothetical protein